MTEENVPDIVKVQDAGQVIYQWASKVNWNVTKPIVTAAVDDSSLNIHLFGLHLKDGLRANVNKALNGHKAAKRVKESGWLGENTVIKPADQLDSESAGDFNRVLNMLIPLGIVAEAKLTRGLMPQDALTFKYDDTSGDTVGVVINIKPDKILDIGARKAKLATLQPAAPVSAAVRT